MVDKVKFFICKLDLFPVRVVNDDTIYSHGDWGGVVSLSPFSLSPRQPVATPLALPAASSQ